MTRKINVIAQLAATFAQVVVPAIPIDAEWKNLLHAVLSFTQLAVSIVAHAYTPDGDKI